MKIKSVLNKMNISKHILNHLVGKDHTNTHRRIVGALIMSFGIAFIKIFSLIHFETIQFCAEIIGAGIHGIGLLPFINSIENVS
ncbi:MAG TPA: hypothetical protein VN703_02900 [Candidatus Sulfopaludibacter sp.]|nr:hypothetical protein [Candidatus Sulfopaludibacter sp.]